MNNPEFIGPGGVYMQAIARMTNPYALARIFKEVKDKVIIQAAV